MIAEATSVSGPSTAMKSRLGSASASATPRKVISASVPAALAVASVSGVIATVRTGIP